MTIPTQHNALTTAAFSSDGKRVVTCGDDKTIKVWDLYSGEKVLTNKVNQAPVWSLAFSPDEP